MFSLIKAVEMVNRRVFYPTTGVTRPRLDFNWLGNNLKLQLEEEAFPDDDSPVYIGLSSMGIGESHVLIGESRLGHE
jgi:acyl transferase domain-containing protein